jgi:periplasmic divalent cation tolerance protein
MSSRRALAAAARGEASAARNGAARGYLLVVTTVASAAQARRLAHTLVQESLAACVHVWPIQSVYRWRARLQAGREYRVVCKSSAARRSALLARLRALHPYELPAIYALKPSFVDEAYGHWIDEGCMISRGVSKRRRG